MVALQVFFVILTAPLLYIITFLNVEHIFQNNFLDPSLLIYGIYLLLSGLGLLIIKHINFKNNNIKKEWISNVQFIFHMSILALPAIGLIHYFVIGNGGGESLYLRVYGKVAFLYLTLALSIAPIVSFVKNKKISDNLILMKKVLGILSFMFFLRHGIEYFTMEYVFSIKHSPAIGYLDYVWQNLLIRRDALTGVAAGILMFVLGITSNKMSIKILSGNLWKKVQSFVYPTFLISSIHVSFSSRFDAFYVILILFLVYIRTISYLHQKNNNIQKGGPTTKYLCTPCGYIYDEALGDPDGGLAPGTKFEDIPDDWKCPVCGVTKLSFEPYYTEQSSISEGYVSEVADYLMLTKDVLELSLKVNQKLNVLPGQHVSLVLKDFDGEFTRKYSIVETNGNIIKLGIKIKDTGRGGRALKALKIGSNIKIKDISGNFILKNSSNKKIFIATGTGLSPLYNMILNNKFSKNNMLFRGVTTKDDLFYLDQLNNFKNLKVEIFLSKENVDPYHNGRINISMYDFPMDTEFYLCGNTAMVKEQMDMLNGKGYRNIYVEIF